MNGDPYSSSGLDGGIATENIIIIIPAQLLLLPLLGHLLAWVCENGIALHSLKRLLRDSATEEEEQQEEAYGARI